MDFDENRPIVCDNGTGYVKVSQFIIFFFYGNHSLCTNIVPEIFP